METLEGSELGQGVLQEGSKAIPWWECLCAVVGRSYSAGEGNVMCIQPEVQQLGAEACMEAGWVQDSAGL